MQKDNVITNSKLTGITSGIAELDKLTNNWQNSNLIVFAARSNMGKKALMISMSKNMALDNNIPVAICSLDICRELVVSRLKRNDIGIEAKRIRDISQSEFGQKLDAFHKKLRTAPLYIDGTVNSISITKLESRIRQLVQDHQVKCMFIDHLELIERSEDNRRLIFRSHKDDEFIMKTLAKLAIELDILIIVLIEFYGGPDKDCEDKSPSMCDFDEMSEFMEQYIDGIYFIHRSEYYLSIDNSDCCCLAEIIKARQTSDGREKAILQFIPEISKFKDWENDAELQIALKNLEKLQAYYTAERK